MSTVPLVSKELEYDDLMSQQQTDEIFQRLRTLESRPRDAPTTEPLPREKWPKRNAYWFFPTVAVLVALLIGSGLIALVAGSFVDSRIDAKLKDPLERLRKVEDGVTRIETKLDTFIEFLRPLIADRIRAAASLKPEQLRKELPQIKDALLLAREQRVTASTEQLKEIGSRAIDLAVSGDNQAWQTVTAALNYRSFLTVRPPETLSARAPLAGDTWRYFAENFPGQPRFVLQFAQGFGVPANQAARMERIGADRNSSLPTGPLFLIASGGTAILDNEHLRNVIFDNVQIHYSGQPVILENVTFVNCTFIVDNNKSGRSLGGEVLASAPVNFKSIS